MQSELGSNIATHPLGRRRRQREDWGSAKVSANLTDLTVLWTEVVSPLADTVRLIHCQQRDALRWRVAESSAKNDEVARRSGAT